MKATQEQRQFVERAVAQVDNAERRNRYIVGDYPRAGHTKDINKRYRWDTYYLAIDRGLITYDTLRDLQDSHIDTVLRQVIPTLTKEGK